MAQLKKLGSRRTSGLGSLSEDEPGRRRRPSATAVMFFSQDVDRAKDSVKKIIDQANHAQAKDTYKPTGWAQRVVKSSLFEQAVFLLICLNALWIGIETDHNPHDVLWKSHWVFVLGENLFCFFFILELCVRFAALQEKATMVRNRWLFFDCLLVFFMVLDVWVFGLFGLFVNTDTPDLGPLLFIRITRFTRLLRVARMAKLAQHIPEILVIVEGMLVGMRSVFFMLVTLLGITYIFAVVLRLLSEGTPLVSEHRYFATVPDSMFTLVTMGIYMDEITQLTAALRAEGIGFVAVFACFLFVCSHGLMNFLIGVLCGVVHHIGEREKLRNLVLNTSERISATLKRHPDIDPEAITRDDIFSLFGDEEAISTLGELGVDPLALVEIVDVTFKDEDVARRGVICQAELLDLVVSVRGSNTATVKDLAILRRSLYLRLDRSSGAGIHSPSSCSLRGGGCSRAETPQMPRPPLPAQARDASGGPCASDWSLPAAPPLPAAPELHPADVAKLALLSSRTVDISNELDQLTRQLAAGAKAAGPAAVEAHRLWCTLDATASQLTALLADTGNEGNSLHHSKTEPAVYDADPAGAPGWKSAGWRSDPGLDGQSSEDEACCVCASDGEIDKRMLARRFFLPQEVPYVDLC